MMVLILMMAACSAVDDADTGAALSGGTQAGDEGDGQSPFLITFAATPSGTLPGDELSLTLVVQWGDIRSVALEGDWFRSGGEEILAWSSDDLEVLAEQEVGFPSPEAVEDGFYANRVTIWSELNDLTEPDRVGTAIQYLEVRDGVVIDSDIGAYSEEEEEEGGVGTTGA